VEMEKAAAAKKVKEEDRLRKRAEEIKKAQEEAKREATKKTSSRGSGAGMMNDPDLIEAMKNPKVSAALSELMSGPGGPMGIMSNPAKLQELMSGKLLEGIA
jgi:uncharacterized protein YjgD (DUF1641 family)